MASVTRRARTDVDAALNMEERLQLALERLLDRGLTITAISIDALAREAGIARATFYLHFRDKGELVARLIARVADEVVGAGGLWFVHAEDARFEDLRAAMARFFDAYMQHHAILAAAAETAPYDAQVGELHSRMIERFVAESRQAVQRIADSGRAHAGLPTMVAEVLSWSVNHTYVQYGKGLDDARREAFIDTWTHVVWHAIFAPDK
ncbi:MAG: TetR/AcrR family transcriptional regulator [Proteobacteria bacterium]|jgi:AcrR family transcriptional regulator|nr:TetR/AcrR family transcriptional regulator [Pseudomonadota bacterium]